MAFAYNPLQFWHVQFIQLQTRNRSIIRLVAAKPTTSEQGALAATVSAAEMDTSLSLMRTVSMTWT